MVAISKEDGMLNDDDLGAKPPIPISRAAEIAGISLSTAYAWANAGLLARCVQIHGRYYVRTAAFLRWLDGQEEAA